MKSLNIPENMDHSGAHDLADRIRRYWRRQGYDVRTELVAIRASENGKERQLYCLRSDMVNGMPQRRWVLKAAAQ